VDEIEAKADLFTKIVVQCERQLPPTSTAVKHLKRLVFDFRETMPIVGALGNKNLQPEHWDDIKDVLSLDREFPL
jgi:dynein heavy chain